jgi:hypothetical protein
VFNISELVFGKLYRESRWSSVMVRRYGELKASAESIPLVEGGCLKTGLKFLDPISSVYIVKEPSSNPKATFF